MDTKNVEKNLQIYLSTSSGPKSYTFEELRFALNEIKVSQ